MPRAALQFGIGETGLFAAKDEGIARPVSGFGKGSRGGLAERERDPGL